MSTKPEIESHRVDEFKGGWFIGRFSPTLHANDAVEVAIKSYKAGDAERRHVHRIATEYTVITSGAVEMNGITYSAGTIVRVPPGCDTDFRALTDACTTVVKLPCVAGDKYLV